MQLLVDPILVSIPNATASPEKCFQFVKQLSDWSGEVRAGRHQFFVSATCLQAMINSHRHPLIDNLSGFFKKLGPVVDTKTVYDACSRILHNLPYLEDRVGAPVALVCDVEVNPDLASRIDDPGIAAAFAESLGYVAYARETLKHETAVELCLVTYPILNNSDNLPAEDIQINAKIETEGGDEEVKSNIDLVARVSDLQENLIAIWQDFDKALDWMVQTLHDEYGITRSSLAEHAISPEFYETIREYHFDREENLKSIYRRIALLLSGVLWQDPDSPPFEIDQNKHIVDEDRKPIRYTDSTGDWIAWRCHISGKQMRLHYWWQRGKFILMSVVPHSIVTISPPKKST